MTIPEDIAYMWCPNNEYEGCKSCADCAEAGCTRQQTARLAWEAGGKQELAVCHGYVYGFARAVNIVAILRWMEDRMVAEGKAGE